MEIWELIARESIRDLVARYNANGDSGRFEPMLDLFAEESTMEIPGDTYQGKAAIRGMFEGVATRTGASEGPTVKFIRHCTSTHQIDLQSETEAKGRCYYMVLTDKGLDHWGRYIDEYRRVDGEWRFWHRKVTMDTAVPDAWATER